MKNDNDSNYNFMDDFEKVFYHKVNSLEDDIVRILNNSSRFLNFIKEIIPISELRPCFTSEQMEGLKNGTFRLLKKNNGELLGSIINPKTKQIVANVPLKEFKSIPNLGNAVMNLQSQLQIQQIIQEIRELKLDVENVRIGQVYDRLALVYSAKQKFLQICTLKNPQIKEMAFIQLCADVEDAKHQLLLNLKPNLLYIMNQPTSLFMKLLKGVNNEKVESRIEEIRQSVIAINASVITQIACYTQLGEQDAVRICLSQYSDSIHRMLTSHKKLIERLDLCDAVNTNYWSTTLPNIVTNIQAIENKKEIQLIGRNEDEE